MSERDKQSVQKEDNMSQSKSQVNSGSVPTRIQTDYVFDAYNMPKINCYYHKGQTITNFCCCPQCLIPLCPVCVQLHTQEHTEDGTYPNLECMELVLNEIYATMSNETNLFADAFQDLTQHVIQMQTQSQITHVRLSEIKTRVIKIVEQFFHSLENDIFNKQKKNAENQQRDAELLKSMVRERWESHMQFLEELNTPSSMKSVIPYFGSSILEDNSQYFQLLNNYLNRFKEINSELSYDQNRISDISNHLGSLIKLKHKNIPEFLEIHHLPHPHISQSKPIQAIQPQIQQKKPKIIIHPPPLSQSNRSSPQIQAQSRMVQQFQPQSQFSTARYGGPSGKKVSYMHKQEAYQY